MTFVLSSEILRSIGMTFIWVFVIDLGFDEINEENNPRHSNVKSIYIIPVVVAFFGSEIIQYVISDTVLPGFLVGILASFKLFLTIIGLLSLAPIFILEVYLLFMTLIVLPTEIPLSRRVKYGH